MDSPEFIFSVYDVWHKTSTGTLNRYNGKYRNAYIFLFFWIDIPFYVFKIEHDKWKMMSSYD